MASFFFLLLFFFVIKGPLSLYFYPKCYLDDWLIHQLADPVPQCWLRFEVCLLWLMCIVDGQPFFQFGLVLASRSFVVLHLSSWQLFMFSATVIAEWGLTFMGLWPMITFMMRCWYSARVIMWSIWDEDRLLKWLYMHYFASDSS